MRTSDRELAMAVLAHDAARAYRLATMRALDKGTRGRLARAGFQSPTGNDAAHKADEKPTANRAVGLVSENQHGTTERSDHHGNTPAKRPPSYRGCQVDGPVVLRERVAIHRYRLWREYRIAEGDTQLLTFLEWLGQANIRLADPEAPGDLDESGPLPGFGSRAIRIGGARAR
jgi:hypothetical protein